MLNLIFTPTQTIEHQEKDVKVFLHETRNMLDSGMYDDFVVEYKKGNKSEYILPYEIFLKKQMDFFIN